MQTLWRWFVWSVVGIGVLFAIFCALFITGMNHPVVNQSVGFTSVTAQAKSNTLSQSLPASATNVRHCRASVGLGGRLLIYRFSAPVSDLHKHARNEFAAHWDNLRPQKTPNSPPPISEHEASMWESGFGIEGGWMLPPADSVGTIYRSADGQVSHRPVIFVDDENGVLYFKMTD